MDVQTAATLADLRQQLDAARRDNDFLRGFSNNPDLQELRDDLDAARADAAMWQKEHAEQGVALTEARADVVRLTALVTALRKNANDADLELAKSMSRANVLANEAKHWRHWYKSCQPSPQYGTHLGMATLETDRTHALDPAKFEEQP
jgi:multidrug resistance efflux pump